MASRDCRGDLRLGVGLVRQLRFAGQIADGEDVRFGGTPLPIDRHETALVELDARGGEAEILAVRPPADGHEHAVVVFSADVVLLVAEGDFHAVVLQVHRIDLGIEHDRREFAVQPPLEHRHQITVHTRQQSRHHLDDGHLAAQRGVDRTELQPDIATADDQQSARYVRQRQGAGRVDDARVVLGCARERDGARTGGEDRLLEGQCQVGTVDARHGERVGIGQLRRAP